MKDLSKVQHFVGCDVSKETLDFAIHERGKDYRQFKHIRVENSIDGFRKMRKWLRESGIKVTDVVIAMEHTGIYSAALTEWCFGKKIAFVMLHPRDVKNACSRGRDKTDKVDSQFIADYVYTMREKLSPSNPEPAIIRKLRQLCNERKIAIRTRTAYLNIIKTLTDKASIKRTEDFIKTLNKQIKTIEKAMVSTVESDPEVSKNYNLVCSVPGIGMINAVATIVATSNFTRFQNARQYAKFSCISPMSFTSGTSVKGGDHVSRVGHGELKALLTEAAKSTIVHDSGIKAYYNRKREQGKSFGCVLNAVKFKLICRMFAVVKRQTPYVNTEKFRN